MCSFASAAERPPNVVLIFVDDLGYPYAFANPDWPGPRATGGGYRGGTEGLLGLSEVTDRTYGAYEATYGNESQGFRGVLNAPSE